MRTVRDIPILENIPVLVRGALNVPVENGVVVNEYRLRSILPTLTYLRERRARVILISHIGDMGTETLAPVAEALAKLFPHVSFFPEHIGTEVRGAIRALPPGHILMLENLRRSAGEKKNDTMFAKELSLLADVFVQDSFDTCHRTHASIIGVPKLLPSYAGLSLEKEVRELSRARAPKSPSLAVIGGAKFATKKAVLGELLATYDKVFVGGALANDFLKARGQEVGKSLVSGADDTSIEHILQNPRLLLPEDVIAVANGTARVAAGDVHPEEHVLDIGPATSARLAQLAGQAQSILWNGPLGNYENGFVDGTQTFARAVARSRAYSSVGGGDTVAAIETLGLLPRFSFVSTGGGAMLEFLAKGTLPGIEALG
jgi:phosphoglycerate kinase